MPICTLSFPQVQCFPTVSLTTVGWNRRSELGPRFRSVSPSGGRRDSLSPTKNGRAHLPPKKSLKRGASPSRPDRRMHSTSSSSARAREKEILDEFQLDDFGFDEVNDRALQKKAVRQREKRRERERQRREKRISGSDSEKRKRKSIKKEKDPSNDLSTGASFRRGAEVILKREGKPMDAREIVRVGLREGTLFLSRAFAVPRTDHISTLT